MLKSKDNKELVKYVPKLQGRKWITANTINNGGLHKQEEFRKGVDMLEFTAHHFRNPRLFHICFTGADMDIYQLALIRFCRGLTAGGVRYRYKAAVEKDEQKGTHLHVMIVLEAIQQTPRFITSQNEFMKMENESLLRKAVRHTWDECSTLGYRVCTAYSTGLPFIQFNQTNMEFFNEAVEWMSYIYKARSKPESGQVYFSDRQEGQRVNVPTKLHEEGRSLC